MTTVNADQISALVTMQGFHSGKAVNTLAPFGAACHFIVYAAEQIDKEEPYAIMGLFDIIYSNSSINSCPHHGRALQNRKQHSIINDFQTRFVDVAGMYHKRTGKEISFVPLYVAPRLKKLVLGKPIRYCAANPKEQERERICDHLMEEITSLACSLPPHTVVPYKNIPKKDYPSNVILEGYTHR